MEKYITLKAIMIALLVFAVAHIITGTGEAHPYVAGSFVVMALLRLEDSLKKGLTF